MRITFEMGTRREYTTFLGFRKLGGYRKEHGI
jgi:hypothetical protein